MMKIELSIAELENELSAELPTRNLMRWRHSRRGGGARASFGSAAASNVTHQSNSNSQTFVNTGFIAGGIHVSSHNTNNNTTTQNLTPINIDG